MPHRTLTTLLALLATAAGGAALADGAQASVVASPIGVVVDNDGFPDLLADPEVTLTDENIAFTWGVGTVTPRLTAVMHVVKGDNTCYRVRTDSLDADGTLVGSAYDDETGHCRHSDAPVDIPVDMRAVGGPDVKQVVVALEKQGTADRWRTKDTSEMRELSTHDDKAKVLGAGIDIGGPDWLNGAPTTSARISWELGADGLMTATYDGTLHLKGFYPGSGRVVIRAYDPVTGFRYGTDEGTAQTPADNGLHSYPETLSVTSSNGTSLEVITQSLVTDPLTGTASWQDVSRQVLSAAE